MVSMQRTPPRFVPTLTTVVEELPQPAPVAEDAAPVEVVPATVEPSQAVALSPEVRLSEASAFRLEEQLLHRVLQRVDLQMEERLSDVVSAAVQHHLDTMIPGLRKEIEAVLRALVSESLSHELSENPGSTPTFGPHSLG
jgi:hypothetical protein